jgi:hypothetical protein
VTSTKKSKIKKLFARRKIKFVFLNIKVLAGAFDIPHELKNSKQNLQMRCFVVL